MLRYNFTHPLVQRLLKFVDETGFERFRVVAIKVGRYLHRFDEQNTMLRIRFLFCTRKPTELRHLNEKLTTIDDEDHEQEDTPKKRLKPTDVHKEFHKMQLEVSK